MGVMTSPVMEDYSIVFIWTVWKKNCDKKDNDKKRKRKIGTVHHRLFKILSLLNMHLKVHSLIRFFLGIENSWMMRHF